MIYERRFLTRTLALTGLTSGIKCGAIGHGCCGEDSDRWRLNVSTQKP
jgi:hypothetical protein